MNNKIESDIYLQLINDMLDRPLTEEEIYTPLLQMNNENNQSVAGRINDYLTDSCKYLAKAIHTKNIVVGANSGYVEPCPISYTGSVVNGSDKFSVVFIGLNPFLEGPRQFKESTSYADLANIHHPDDIIYSTGKDYTKLHQYRRILGCRENRTDWGAWSPYYKDVIRIHLALLPKGHDEWYSTWPKLQEKGKALATNATKFYDEEDIKYKKVRKDFISSMALQKYLLEKLRIYPIANAELIPYKSKDFQASCLTNLLKDRNDPFHKKYYMYFGDIFRFIYKYSSDKAYIVVTTKISDMTELKDFLIKYDPKNLGIPVFTEKEVFPFEGKQTIQFCLIKWGLDDNYRRLVIMPSISRQSQYGQILQDIGNSKKGWVYEVKKRFGDI